MRELSLVYNQKTIPVMAERFPPLRIEAIERYLQKEAGVRPPRERIRTALLARETWPFDNYWRGFFQKVKIVNPQKKVMRRVPFIALKTQDRDLDENRIFVHEYLGHGFFLGIIYVGWQLFRMESLLADPSVARVQRGRAFFSAEKKRRSFLTAEHEKIKDFLCPQNS